jgi:alpha-galactosidase
MLIGGMTEKPSSSLALFVAPLPTPLPSQIMAMIRFMATETDRVIIGDHAQERMQERGILTDDLFEVLRLGELKGRITPGGYDDEWKCKVVGKPRGSRQIGAVTIIKMKEYLFIKTVEWEDR